MAQSAIAITEGAWSEVADASLGALVALVEPKTTKQHVYTMAASPPSNASIAGFTLVNQAPTRIAVPSGLLLYVRTLAGASSVLVEDAAA